jgi:hypothetical protein
MLKVNSTSSKNAGNGTTNSARMSSTSDGAPTLFALNHEKRSETCRKFDSMASKVRYLPLIKANVANSEYCRRKFRTKFGQMDGLSL